MVLCSAYIDATAIYTHRTRRRPSFHGAIGECSTDSPYLQREWPRRPDTTQVHLMCRALRELLSVSASAMAVMPS